MLSIDDEARRSFYRPNSTRGAPEAGFVCRQLIQQRPRLDFVQPRVRFARLGRTYRVRRRPQPVEIPTAGLGIHAEIAEFLGLNDPRPRAGDRNSRPTSHGRLGRSYAVAPKERLRAMQVGRSIKATTPKGRIKVEQRTPIVAHGQTLVDLFPIIYHFVVGSGGNTLRGIPVARRSNRNLAQRTA